MIELINKKELELDQNFYADLKLIISLHQEILNIKLHLESVTQDAT